ncbi:MAG: hypothetical protein JNL88_13305 [Bacteroidia bacterium]|nr:hypothetical protein [Bacteroidia bacterium]
MRKSTLILCLLLFPVFLRAQENAPAAPVKEKEARRPLKDRLFFGGNLGLSFGTLTYINVSPVIGYRLTEKFGAGLGPVYTYYSDNRDRRYKYETHMYGGRTFAQYQVMENVLLYSEYELINMEVPDLLFTKLIRKNISSLFVGGGYAQNIGGRTSLSLMVLFNVIEGDYRIYENPVIRTGINVGF